MRASILAASLLVISGCGDESVVVVEPATPAPGVATLFVTWEIQSDFYGPVDCVFVGGNLVNMDLVNIDTGERLVFGIPCEEYQGESQRIGVGTFDILLNLTDVSGATISQANLGATNVSVGGNIDLGHVIFPVP